ncbi:MAG: histidinol-phosphate transaminase [Lachnospiraceae bacterium]|nr:histidinol-phosphate transaminase [Lachnospiraceae bacterium]
MVHRHGGDIYSYPQIQDFSANINFRGMPEQVREAARRAVDVSMHYPDPDYRTLRRALAGREQVEDSRIICGNGAAELMFALAAARRPRQALLAVPSFFEYEQALTAFGCGISYFYLREQQGFALEEAFLEAVGDDTELIVLGNPNNPTGQLVQSELLRRLLELCRERGIFLVLDESFFDFLCEADREKTLEGGRQIQEHPNLFVLKSFTKIYAMPGLRFGYGICSDLELLQTMRTIMQPWNVSIPAQMAAEAACMETGFACETAEQTARNRKEMKTWLEQAGYQVFDSNTNFLMFRDPSEAEGSVTGDNGRACVSLKDYCLKYGFLIRDCSNFPGLSKGYYRICVRSREENEKLFRVLEEAARLRKY